MNIKTNITKIASMLWTALLLTALLTLATTPGIVAAQGDFSAPTTLSDPPVGTLITESDHTCALRPDSSVDCWGDNLFGHAEDQPGPFTQISAGGVHTCGLTPDGSVDCWGFNSRGQATDQPGPFAQISAGGAHTCGLRPDGSVDCWGYNDYGQATGQPGPFAQISAGDFHTCGLKPDGSVGCWGNNFAGQATDQPGPFTQVSGGWAHTCGLKPDGSVDCWGYNGDGQATDQPGPFTQISAGYAHTCGLKPDGSVDCWGWNHFGQAEDKPGPFTLISAGYTHTCGLKTNGSIDCWGANDSGQATDQPGPFGPSVPDSTSPVITPTITGTLGNGDWFISDVTVSWSIVDEEADISSQSGCDTTTINTDTEVTTLTCSATSAGGTASESVTIQRDATAPILNPVVSPNPLLLGGNATVSSNASDTLSGLASQNCGTVDTSTVGVKTVACTATDNAGNTATVNANYHVIYDFDGFFSPVDPLPTLNTVKAGQSIPVKFSLGGDQGLDVFATGYPRAQQIACDTGAPGDAIEETVASGTSGLQYDPLTDTYTYVWKTQKSWARTCRQLILRLADGTEHSASFQFK